MRSPGLRLSVIVPFHRNLQQLDECLGALAPLPKWAEMIVVADGAAEPCHEVVVRHGGRVVEIDGPRGPAVARNRGAAAAFGDVLVFIDTDVVAAPGTLTQFRELLHCRPRVAAIFGSYDEAPRDVGFMSQYKNLAHSYFHQSSRRDARTFWAGLGAVRRSAFEAVGGFEEGFGRPSVEDIELGYRLSLAGYKILLDPSIRGCHLKRWSLQSAIVTDVVHRGIPWTQLILNFGRLDNDLNLQWAQRLAVVLSYMLILSLGLAVWQPVWLAVAALLLLALCGVNWRYYAFFLRRRGLWFGVRVLPVHLLHHICNGLSFVTGTALFYTNRHAGLTLPGAVPLAPRTSPASRMSIPG